MADIMDRQERINESRDWTHQFQCGCQVVFLGSCFHKSSRMTACVDHGGRDQTDKRTRMVDEAKGYLELAKLTQPPK